ncbi:Cro/Cl family transcriptional regulator [Burkholderia stagnalis]|uniref:Cro/Cl family transcriptional regulator n=1 Tax=Burkholderia stagnalis TaxID=1503054 RepID=UPI000F58C931|nr:Cro/Cl family transcriptional regulator [Burkholderia stagnalis]RQQ03017.1 Cro/Cl family transcriptional regulator [Burkholderia stagnalis]RQQ11477.1 Cro/Cl family transcriptional regulator [Burkholderia stagnalis]RQQ32287.1 Cro/Cl family transcriptional regulator [Burkholderia stagnalis]RQQ32404.1 Cro/Cl family transcriptional regulator [Burkholderia stagnalis]RQQ46961.1 Cro/Cl family transcriptional regulator [Burkholderia stagnalis]
MRIAKYLDALQKALGVENDKEMALRMGWSHSVPSHWRTGRRSMDNETCLRIAEALGMDNPLPIIMAADMDRAEKAGQHSLWESFLPKMTGLSAALAVSVVTNFVTPSPAEAATHQGNGAATVEIMSIK